jgi:hypothetical protein
MHPFWISFTAVAAFLIVESVSSWIFIRCSKKNHPMLWEHAGCPTDLPRLFRAIHFWRTARLGEG